MHFVSIIFIVGTALAALGAAAYFWRQAAGMEALLIEAANRFEVTRKSLHTMTGEAKKAEEKLARTRDQVASLEKSLEHSRTTLNHHQNRHDGRLADLQSKVEKLTQQLDIKSRNFDALDSEMTELRSAKDATASRLAEVLANFDDRVREATAKSKSRATDLQRETEKLREEHSRAMADVARLKIDVDKVKPAEALEYKRKAASYYKLYATMKSLREMAEDRNRNWEVALRKLAAYVVKNAATGHRNATTDFDTVNIGPLVGEALERIGAHLIDPAVDHADAASSAHPKTDRPRRPHAEPRA